MPPKDPEERAAYMRKWREENPERVRENQRRYEEKNREALREQRRAYYRQNRDQVLAKLKARRDADPEVFKRKKAEQARRRRAKDPERARREARQRNARNKYGLTLEEYDAILARGCAICGTHAKRICMDHDHSNGKVRDALCNTCNSGLGAFGDEPRLLRAAADYLETHARSLHHDSRPHRPARP